jgi:hypothetical protein
MPVPCDATASEVWEERPFLVEIDGQRLIPGQNCLALQALNHADRQDRFYLKALLLGESRFDGQKGRELLAGFREAAAGEDAENRVLYMEGRLLLKEGKAAQAAEILSGLAARQPKSPLPHLRLAESLRSSGQFYEAEERLHTVLWKFPDNAAVWNLWHEIAVCDLKLSPAQLVSRLSAGTPTETTAFPEGYGTDVLWLLRRLTSRDAVRINCGGEAFTGAGGEEWRGDQFFRGGRVNRDAVEVATATEDTLYRTKRLFPDTGGVRQGYRIPVPAGKYQVTLHFAEREFVRPSRRIFKLLLEDKQELTDYSPGEAGFAAPRTMSFPSSVEDGFLDLDFTRERGTPLICGLEVRRLE